MKKLSLLLLVFCAVHIHAQDPLLKKLGWKSNTASKIAALEELSIIIEDSAYTNANWAAKYSRIAFYEAKKIEYNEGQVDALHNLCRALIYSNKIDSALDYALVALNIADRSNEGKLKVQAHNVVGGIYSYQNQNDKAANEYFLAVRIAEKTDKKLALTPYANLGHVFKMLGNYNKCREYSERGYKLAKEYKDTSIMMITLNLLGLVEYHDKNFDKALRDYDEALLYADAFEDVLRQSQIVYNMANVYMEKKNFDKALDLYNHSIELTKSGETYLSTGMSFLALGQVMVETKRYGEAKAIADSVMLYARLSQNMEILMEGYSLKAALHLGLKKYEVAYHYLDTAFKYKDSMQTLELNNTALSAEDQYLKEKKSLKDSLDQVQRELKTRHEKTINDQKIHAREVLLWISGVVLLFVIFGIYYLFKKNRLIQAQKDLVSQQKEEIQIQHTAITDSIHYALRIQEAILPTTEQYERICDDYFVLFKPKDVVSGDFHWTHTDEVRNLAIWVVADCTGHGVPGAFMSMLGVGLLNEIVVEGNEANPGRILDELRTKIILALNQEGGTSSRDGMDVAVCVWDKASKILQYAGANNPMWLIRKDVEELPPGVHKVQEASDGFALLEFTPDKMPIGLQLQTPPPFRVQQISVNDGDLVILFSDGFADQFGGPNNKKLKYLALKNRLLQHHQLPLNEQGKQLGAYFDAWCGDNEQTDDVCVVGVRLHG